jgi:hypothetical protein
MAATCHPWTAPTEWTRGVACPHGGARRRADRALAWPLVAPGYYSSSLLGTSVVSVGDGASVEPVHWTVAGEAFFCAPGAAHVRPGFEFSRGAVICRMGCRKGVTGYAGRLETLRVSGQPARALRFLIRAGQSGREAVPTCHAPSSQLAGFKQSNKRVVVVVVVVDQRRACLGLASYSTDSFID